MAQKKIYYIWTGVALAAVLGIILTSAFFAVRTSRPVIVPEAPPSEYFGRIYADKDNYGRYYHLYDKEGKEVKKIYASDNETSVLAQKDYLDPILPPGRVSDLLTLKNKIISTYPYEQQSGLEKTFSVIIRRNNQVKVSRDRRFIALVSVETQNVGFRGEVGTLGEPLRLLSVEAYDDFGKQVWSENCENCSPAWEKDGGQELLDKLAQGKTLQK
jgi:hypothetical protein